MKERCGGWKAEDAGVDKKLTRVSGTYICSTKNVDILCMCNTNDVCNWGRRCESEQRFPELKWGSAQLVRVGAAAFCKLFASSAPPIHWFQYPRWMPPPYLMNFTPLVLNTRWLLHCFIDWMNSVHNRIRHACERTAACECVTNSNCASFRLWNNTL